MLCNATRASNCTFTTSTKVLVVHNTKKINRWVIASGLSHMLQDELVAYSRLFEYWQPCVSLHCFVLEAISRLQRMFFLLCECSDNKVSMLTYSRINQRLCPAALLSHRIVRHLLITKTTLLPAHLTASLFKHNVLHPCLATPK